MKHNLKKIISGGQSGADLAGVTAATDYCVPTGGWMPQGWKTLDGPKPEYKARFGMKEHTSPWYKPRTWANVKDSDGTIRFFYVEDSMGERCTFNAIKAYNRPYWDIKLKDMLEWKNKVQAVADVIKWMQENEIHTLNVAGNSEDTHKGMFIETYAFMSQLLSTMGFQDSQ